MRTLIVIWGGLSVVLVFLLSDLNLLLLWKPYRDFMNSLPPDVMLPTIGFCLINATLAGAVLRTESTRVTMDTSYPSGHFMQQYGCDWAMQDIDFYFLPRPGPEPLREAAIWRALEHMTAGSTPEHHQVACPTCWQYYEDLKQQRCGG